MAAAGECALSASVDSLVECRARLAPTRMSDHSYLTAEAAARLDIDKMLAASGWVVQNENAANLQAGIGVAIREFHMAPTYGRADYMLLVDSKAVGTLEAKKVGSTLTGVEIQ